MNRSDSVVRVPQGRRAWAACAVGLASVLACTTGDSAVRRSQEVLTQTMQADSAHAAYGLALLAKSQSPYAQQQIVDWIRSDHAQTAREAVKAIVEAPPPAAREALQEVFGSQGGLLKLNAARALAKLGDPAAAEFVSEESLSGGATLTPAIARLLAEGEHVEDLKQILAKRIDDKEQSIRDEAFGVLGEIGQPWATQMLVTGLGKQRGEDRVQAVVSLGRTGDPAVAPKLHKFVNTKGLVFATLDALGALGNPDSLPTVKKMTDHEEPLVRVYAAAAAWRLGDEETGLASLEPIQGLLDHRNPYVVMSAANAVLEIKNRLAPSAT